MRRTVVAALVGVIAGVLFPVTSLASGPPMCAGHPATIWGTSGDDVLIGTDGPDVIVGLAGNDIIEGGDGDDIICGNAGRDQIDGGPGDDLVQGGGGRDILEGGPGDDDLRGARGRDNLRLGDGNDVARGGGGRDRATGGDGFDDCRTEIKSGCEIQALSPGDTGSAVIALQALLKEKAFYGGSVDGAFGSGTASAVVAFHKVIGARRVENFKRTDWQRLLDFEPTVPVPRSGEPDRIEVDITNQVLYFIEDDEVVHILPVSTGSEALYWSPHQREWRNASTPRGDFTLRWRQYGWNTDSTTGWSVYNYWSFIPYYGIHGYPSVPTQPASHGCVRIHIWDADLISPKYRHGLPIHIWDA